MHRLHDMTRDKRRSAVHTRSSGEHLQQVANNQQALVLRFRRLQDRPSCFLTPL
ncbi:hypothetical protein JFU58_23195 [Pseudomonas sp. TH34]|uniref:hypothetical protein n=1 Tax=Pseudomonas sp. TH34 TaxID=2796399 RepID=UPI0019119E2A|nr:hypothetical protein [Pseudomonas sp. TH34]MBK5411434.1 hypothetical protein [Pseudomonas sp. TH34]